MSQPDLITRRDLINLGASTDFVDWFRLRPLEVQVETAGALGTMTVQWRPLGETTWSASAPSEAGSSWTWSIPDPAFADVTFPAHSYSAGDTWVIAASGAVTASGGAYSSVTATRYDIVGTTCSSVTAEGVTWMQPRAVPPVSDAGPAARTWLAHVAIWRLKMRQGANPMPGSGDAALLDRANAAEANLKNIGCSAMRPPDLVDSSTDNTGTGVPLMPISDTLQGW